MTIYDIAKLADVSVATVSRVINNSSKVKDETKQHVLDIIKKNNYTPNIFARGLGLRSIQMIGIMCTDVSDTFYASAVSFLERELRKKGFNSILSCTGNRTKDKIKSLDILLEKQVDAIILIGSVFDKSVLSSNNYIVNNTPIICINGLIELPSVYSYYCDETSITEKITTDLIDKGLKDILFLFSFKSYSVIRKKTGFLSAYKNKNIRVKSLFIKQCTNFDKDISINLDEFFDNKINIDAVIAATDLVAVGVQKTFHKRGIVKPIIGFDNSLLAQCATPSITSIDNKLEDLCVTAIKDLVSLFGGSNIPSKTALQGNIVYRDSFKN